MIPARTQRYVRAGVAIKHCGPGVRGSPEPVCRQAGAVEGTVDKSE